MKIQVIRFFSPSISFFVAAVSFYVSNHFYVEKNRSTYAV